MPRYIGELETDVFGVTADEGKIAHLSFSAAQAAAAGTVHAAITGSGSETVVTTTEITNPPCPRNLVITPGGTTADVKAASITVTGTNMADEVITETFAFLANATGATTGAKAFKTVTSISIPAQDGAGATFAVTFGDKLGLPYKFSVKPVLWATFGGVIETTVPTVAVSSTAVESNTIDLNTALDGTAVDVYMIL
jgi:hypothetical protein